MSSQITFTGHQIEVTDALREFTTKKFDRLIQHYDHIISLHVTFEVEKLLQIAKATVNTAGKAFNAVSSSPSMYESIDALVDKLERQIKDHRRKQTGH